MSPTRPIPIDAHRRRAASDSDSSDSSCSPTTPHSTNAPLPLPPTAYPRIATVSPSTSPILSYFLGQGPPKVPANTLPFRRNFGAPVIDEDDEAPMSPVTKHGRRASAAAWTGSERFAQTANTAMPEQHERATGMLRRLSLGGAMARPQIPQFNRNAIAGEEIKRRSTPPTLPPTPTTPTPRKSRRSNTMASGTQRPKRAPSPMGERILTGHFDSFH
ncbi:hypothetical protein C8Q72DRAFT_598172 [Fomitopsis betulina]|nr:hypothetical protein C8Q72DRAFT_598172 [Fomitopsis betulina]